MVEESRTSKHGAELIASIDDALPKFDPSPDRWVKELVESLYDRKSKVYKYVRDLCTEQKKFSLKFDQILVIKIF